MKERKGSWAHLAKVYETFEDVGRKTVDVDRDVDEKCDMTNDAAKMCMEAAEKVEDASRMSMEAAAKVMEAVRMVVEATEKADMAA